MRWKTFVVVALTLGILAASTGCSWLKHRRATVTDSAILTDIEWSMWHQGAIVWIGTGTGDTLVDKKAAFRDLVSVQNDGGLRDLLQAGQDRAYALLPTAIARCVAEHRGTFVNDMHWVCYTRNRIGAILTDTQAHDFEAVRQEYRNQEQFDDNKSNVASCFNGTALTAVVTEACGAQPQAVKGIH